MTAEAVETLLDGIYIECVEVNFRTCARHTLDLARILVDYFGKKGLDKEKVVGSIGWDPLEKMVMSGKDVQHILPIAPQLVEALKDYPRFRSINVDTVALNNAGAYIVQELGYALAWGNEYLQQLWMWISLPRASSSTWAFPRITSWNWLSSAPPACSGHRL